MIVARIPVLVEASIQLVEVGARILGQHILQIVVAVLGIAVRLMLRPQYHTLVVRCRLIR